MLGKRDALCSLIFIGPEFSKGSLEVLRSPFQLCKFVPGKSLPWRGDRGPCVKWSNWHLVILRIELPKNVVCVGNEKNLGLELIILKTKVLYIFALGENIGSLALGIFDSEEERKVPPLRWS